MRGNDLAEWRHSHGCSIERMARLLEISPALLRWYENSNAALSRKIQGKFEELLRFLDLEDFLNEICLRVVTAPIIQRDQTTSLVIPEAPPEWYAAYLAPDGVLL